MYAWPWGCSSFGRVLDWYAIEAGSFCLCSKGFYSQSTFSTDSHAVSAQPSCAITYIIICVYLKDLKHWQEITSFGCIKILHALLGMGSTALAASVALPK